MEELNNNYFYLFSDRIDSNILKNKHNNVDSYTLYRGTKDELSKLPIKFFENFAKNNSYCGTFSIKYH